MKNVHNIKITIFLKSHEFSQMETYYEIVKKLLPLDFEKEKLKIELEEVEGLEGNEINILNLDITKESHTKLFIKTLKEYLELNQCKILIEQKESRLDENLFFYIRLDKKSALNGEFKLTDIGDCIHIKISIAAFPKKRDVALKAIDEIFL